GSPCNDIPTVLSPANSRLYAIHSDGNAHQAGPFLAGWPAKLAIVNSELLPVVGEGVTGYPVVGGASCPSGGSGPKIGAMPYNAAGAELARWPKLTTDWTVANPTIGSFGTLDTDPSARKVVFGLTRSGYVNAYATKAHSCSPSAWPRFHHDNANSGDYERDAS